MKLKIFVYMIIFCNILAQDKQNLKFKLGSKNSEIIIIKVSNQESIITLNGINNFLTGKASLSLNQIQELKEFALSLDETKNIELKIVGHTDIRGSESYNKKLSLERAKIVEKKLKELLENKKINYIVEGRGKENPISNRHFENRRVEIYIKTI